MLLFQCPGCGARLRAKPEHVLRQFRCPSCRAPLTVPGEPDRGSGGSNAISIGDTGSVRSASSVHLPRAEQGDSSQWEPGKILLDDYLVEKLLGKGGMAEVYLVRSRSTSEQFAVKRVLPHRLRGLEQRRLFLRELRNWLDLPEHPHLTACRFFRTVEEQVVIFAEYVEGGSLWQWIRDHRVATLESVLDVAAQMAWGLEAAHHNGLIHQDVKPANVLMRQDLLGDEGRLAKITDFGLSQAWQAAEGAAQAGRKRGVGTPAYCAPEQAAGASVSPKTDVWSWGVTLLEMLLGRRAWQRGPEVVQVLETLTAAGKDAEPFLVKPSPAVLELLQGVLRRNPVNRLSLEEALEATLAIYERQTGRRYPRQHPVVPSAETLRRPASTSAGGPARWLAKVARLVGHEVVPAETPADPPRSHRTQLVEDLIAYDSAFDLYSRLLDEGRLELKADLATLCDEKARVHRAAGDFGGASVLLDRAITLYGELPGQPEMADRAAACRLDKASLLAYLGKNAAALEAFDGAIRAHQQRSPATNSPRAGQSLADCYAGRAATLAQLGDYSAAQQCLDTAAAILERDVKQASGAEPTDDLADICCDKATVITLRSGLGIRGGRHPDVTGELRGAKTLCDRAMALYGRLGAAASAPKRAVKQARCSISRGNALAALGDYQQAMQSYEFAASYLKPLETDGAEHEQAVCRLNRAAVLGDLEGEPAAIAAYDEALALLEALVLKSGRGDLRFELAMGSLNKAIALRTLGNDLAAVLLADRATRLCQRLVEQEGRRETLPDLAACYLNRAVSIGNRGQAAEAAQLLDRAMAIWDEAERGGREVSVGDVALCLMSQGAVLWRKGEPQAALKLFDNALDRLHLPMFRQAAFELSADAVFCQLNRALVYTHLNKRHAAARALDRVDDLLDSYSILREGPLLRGPAVAPLVRFVYHRVRPGSAPTPAGPILVPDPKQAFQRTRKRLIHLVARGPGGASD